MTKSILVITGGHRVALDDFLQAIAEICESRGWVWAHSSQPSAQQWLTPEFVNRWDVILFHDIPGLGLQRGQEPTILGPEPAVAAKMVELLNEGQGIVVLHHAISAWPGWEGWAEAIGARFHYRPGSLRGVALPASGYRHDRFTVTPSDTQHPICDAIEPFTIDDEIYFAPVLLDRITPLLTHDADMDGNLFHDTFDVVSHGASTGVTCGDRGADGGLHGGSRLMGWTSTAGSSPVATLLMGDGPGTFANPMFRRLLGNALNWACSTEAHETARREPFPIPLP